MIGRLRVGWASSGGSVCSFSRYRSDLLASGRHGGETLAHTIAFGFTVCTVHIVSLHVWPSGLCQLIVNLETALYQVCTLYIPNVLYFWNIVILISAVESEFINSSVCGEHEIFDRSLVWTKPWNYDRSSEKSGPVRKLGSWQWWGYGRRLRPWIQHKRMVSVRGDR